MLTWPTRVSVERPDGLIIELRGLQRSDRLAWQQLRHLNRDWLLPWEASNPGQAEVPMGFQRMRKALDRAGRAGVLAPFMIDAGGLMVGQMHLFEIIWGSRMTASAGYWLDQRATGRGIASWALAMAVDFAIHEMGLHRVEVNVRPENAASLKVVRRVGMPEEGLRRGLVYVDGAWRDHLTFAVTAEDLAGRSLVSQLRAAPSGRP